MQQPYQFAHHDRVSSTPPALPMWDAVVKGDLTREQKNTFFHFIQAQHNHGNYRSQGWVFPFRQFMKLFIVKYSYEPSQWVEIYAFDKTCIRSSFYTNSHLDEIRELK